MALLRIKIPFEIIIILAVLALNGFVIFAPPNSLMNWYSSDDSFYYFKTAQNINEGKGVTFDGIGRASGFHPLWMMICIPIFALARFDLILPLRVLALLSILLHAFSGAIVYHTLKRFISPTTSALASTLWVFSPIIHHTTVQLGMESGINAFFTLLFFSQISHIELQQSWDRKRMLLLGLMAALVLFSRLDNVFLIFIIGLWILLRRSPMRNLLALDLLLAAVSAFCSFFLVVGFYETLRPYLPSLYPMVILAVIIRPLTYFLFGIYGAPPAESSTKNWLRLSAATLIASATISAIMLGAYSAGYFSIFPRPALLVDATLGWFLTIGLRWIYRCLTDMPGLLPKGDKGTPLVWLKRHISSILVEGIWYALPAAAALGIYLGWNKAYFGTLMPISGQIKHWWGSIYTAYGQPVSSYMEFFNLQANIRHGPWELALALPAEIATQISAANGGDYDMLFYLISGFGLAIAALILVRRWPLHRKAIAHLGLIPLATACAAQIVYYNGSQYVGVRNWYWTNHLIFTVFTAGLLLDGALDILHRMGVSKRTVNALIIGLMVFTAFNFSQMLLRLVPPRVKSEYAQAYLSDIRALEEATEPGALIGTTGGGIVAYFIQNRTIVNLDGLMNTAEYFQRIRSGSAHEYLNQIGLDYVYGNAFIVTRTEPFTEIFSTRTELITELEDGALFRYIPKP